MDKILGIITIVASLIFVTLLVFLIYAISIYISNPLDNNEMTDENIYKLEYKIIEYYDEDERIIKERIQIKQWIPDGYYYDYITDPEEIQEFKENVKENE